MLHCTNRYASTHAGADKDHVTLGDGNRRRQSSHGVSRVPHNSGIPEKSYLRSVDCAAILMSRASYVGDLAAIIAGELRNARYRLAAYCYYGTRAVAVRCVRAPSR